MISLVFGNQIGHGGCGLSSDGEPIVQAVSIKCELIYGLVWVV